MIIRCIWPLPHRFYPPSQPTEDTVISTHVFYSFLLRDARKQQETSVTSAGLKLSLSNICFHKDILGSVPIIWYSTKVSINAPSLGCSFGSIIKRCNPGFQVELIYDAQDTTHGTFNAVILKLVLRATFVLHPSFPKELHLEASSVTFRISPRGTNWRGCSLKLYPIILDRYQNVLWKQTLS